MLLLEAGGHDALDSVRPADRWPTNLGGDLDWGFRAEPNPALGGRAVPMNMGKVLGGGTSINVMLWARGHRSDWDYFAAAAGDDAWNYHEVLDIYRRIEDYRVIPTRALSIDTEAMTSDGG